MAEALEKSAVRIVAWRVLPLLFAAYVSFTDWDGVVSPKCVVL